MSHSQQPNRGPAAGTLAKKAGSNGGFGAKALFDDVYGGPPKFGVSSLSPRAEDYSEIFESFHASRASSIPVLDLPAVDESEVFFDVRSSSLDYAEVFGGFHGLDCAVSYEDLLFDQSKGGGRDSSDDEAWTPAGSVSPTEDLDHSEMDHGSNGDCYESFDTNMEFNISYHESSKTSNKDISTGATHISELHAVPGFTCILNESAPIQKKEDRKPSLQVANNDSLTMEFTGGMMKGKHVKKTMSLPSNGDVGWQAFGNDLKPDKAYTRSDSLSNEMFVTVSDISLRTQPSQLPPPTRPPPASDAKKEGFSRLASNGKSVASEGSSGDSSPPFLDVEVDASSSAAASAAAMKEAMKKAQAKLKSAKDFMDRKKEAFQGSAKMGSKNHIVRKEENVSKIVDECISLRDGSVQSTFVREENGMEFSVKEEAQKVTKIAQEVPDSIPGDKLLKVAKSSEERKHGKEYSSSLGSDKIEGDFDGEKIHEQGQEKNAALGVIEQQGEYNKKEKSARGNHEVEYKNKSKIANGAYEGLENNERSKAAKEVQLPKEQKMNVNVAQEVSGAGSRRGRKLEQARSLKVEAKSLEERKHGKEYSSSLGSDKIEGGSEWKEASQFFELVRTDKSGKALEQTNCVQISAHGEKIHEQGQEKNAALGVIEQQGEYNKKEKSARGNHEVEYENKSKIANGAYEGLENNERSKAAKEVQLPKEQKMNINVAQEVSEQVEKGKKVRTGQKPFEVEKKSVGADLSDNSKLVEVQEKGYKLEAESALKHRENEQKLQEANKQIKSEERLGELGGWEHNEQTKKEAFVWEGNERGLEEGVELAEDEKTLKEALEHKEKEMRLKQEVNQEDEKGRKHKKDCETQKEESIKNAALEQQENKKPLQKVPEREEHEKRLKQGLEQEVDDDRKTEFPKEEKIEKRLVEAMQWEENEKKQQEACARKEKEERLKDARAKAEEKSPYGASDQEDDSANLKWAQDRSDTGRRSKEEFKTEDIEKKSKEAAVWEESKKWLKDASGVEELKVLNRVHEQFERDKNGKTLHLEGEDLGISDGDWKLDRTHEVLAHEETGKRESEPKDREGVEAIETVNVLVGENFKTSHIAQGDLSLEKNEFRMEDTTTSLPLDDCVKKTGEPGFGVRQTNIYKTRSLSQLDSDINQESKFAHDWRERGHNIQQAQAILNQEESKDKFIAPHGTKDRVDNGKKKEAAQPTPFDVEGNMQKTAPQVNGRQTTERKEKNLNETITSEDKETERVKRERELEMDRLRKLEEEREREREREKDRMAVDRSTLEARERYTEAREKAERAAVERAMTEARERLERACAEAREKTFSEKTTMETRLRAERAAVERATAEARERSVGKAMAEKAGFGIRERVEIPVSDRSSASFRSNEMKQSSSSVYGAPYHTERFEGVESESPQRCKARLERHQRTTERAAKALAEKKRDLLAQKKQAERNKITSRKRILILGPDSGWQPLPLTEVITAAAVKKAYRKATLCIHPDKLQQRGASIQQKYICEKVFDLLKWLAEYLIDSKRIAKGTVKFVYPLCFLNPEIFLLTWE
ncbi:Auxilin-like protein 1 [Morella rubra]|uniref:Auxilin-like protein 1 n=1 Tax=Morella rubra TaxID=262757 RepID=A0A6A1VRI9_9ROSI|nr:Auxilin-like protein 1 [Morella rubra]